LTVSGNDYDCVETCISKEIDIYEEFMINYKLDYQNTIKITEEREVIYTISSKHRGHKKNKSNWSIKMPIEVSLFKSALKKGCEDGNVTVIPGEVVRWRVYPRSKNYLNHLHLVYEDRLEIYSFNHDALVNQETKKIGIEYIPDEVHIYKSKSDSATAMQAGIFDNLVLKSGDFNEFNLDDTELPF
jgi:hypothetical protein